MPSKGKENELYAAGVFNEMPSMTDLRYLKHPSGEAIDIPERIGLSYEKFGTHLLKDEYGNKVLIIKHDTMKEVVATNVEILRRWLAGSGERPVTWATLIKVVQLINPTLAKQIREALTQST